MTILQEITILLFGVAACFALILGMYHCHRKNPYGLTPFLGVLGSFVWVDAVIVGLFWLLVCGISLWLQDFLLFLFVLCVFWFVRSIGESVYWFLEQFASTHHNPPRTLLLHTLFHDDSIWIAYQVYWQCMSVASLVAAVYTGVLWIEHIR